MLDYCDGFIATERRYPERSEGSHHIVSAIASTIAAVHFTHKALYLIAPPDNYLT